MLSLLHVSTFMLQLQEEAEAKGVQRSITRPGSGDFWGEAGTTWLSLFKVREEDSVWDPGTSPDSSKKIKKTLETTLFLILWLDGRRPDG